MTSRAVRRLTRVALASIGAVIAGVIAVSGATAALADTDPAARTLSLTREDGSPIGTLFSDWTMVPGDVVHTTVIAHRTGGGESNLMITLVDGVDGVDGVDDVMRSTGPKVVEQDVLITIAGNGFVRTASAAELKRADVVFDLGRSAKADVPIDVTFELAFSSGNESQLQSVDLSLVVKAADTGPVTPAGPGVGAPAPSAGGSWLPSLPSTGASVRDVLIIAAVATSLGLLLIGGRRRSDEAVGRD